MRRLRPRERVVALAGVQLADAAFNAVPTQWLRDDLDHLGVPENLRAVFPVVKSASAVGLLGGLRWPRLGRLTANALIVYFLLALGFHDRAHAEVKSMHTTAPARGRGVARAILVHLVDTARARGCTRISLETGNQEAFGPARALYTSLGFVPCPAFNGYWEGSSSVFLTL